MTDKAQNILRYADQQLAGVPEQQQRRVLLDVVDELVIRLRAVTAEHKWKKTTCTGQRTQISR